MGSSGDIAESLDDRGEVPPAKRRRLDPGEVSTHELLRFEVIKLQVFFVGSLYANRN